MVDREALRLSVHVVNLGDCETCLEVLGRAHLDPGQPSQALSSLGVRDRK